MRYLRLAAVAVIRYAVISLTGFLTFVIFRLANRTTVLGRSPGLLRRVIVVSNHQSLIDSFLVGGVMFYPGLYWRPWLLPFQLADSRNFLSHPVMKHIYALLHVVPVGRAANGDRRDRTAFSGAIKQLERGAMFHVFIEGTRSTDGQLLEPKPQVAGMALLSGASILPVYFTGMHAVQPYRKVAGDGPATWLRIFGKQIEWLLDIRMGNRLTINFGEIITPEKIEGLAGDGKLTARSERLASAIMERLRSLKQQTDCHHDGRNTQRLAS